VKHIAYAETEFATDDRLAELVLEYATLLARSNSADTITIPGRIGDGAIEAISILVGPASQITAWSDELPFGDDVTDATEDIAHRIRAISSSIGTSEEEPPEGFDAFGELS
jgi:hypothetical protein